MKLYLVRHGESKFNAQELHQHNDVELSNKGIQQARFVANRFRDIPIDIIISSTHQRAQQTSEEIKKVLNKEIFYTDLLVEIRNPSEIRGKSYYDPEVMRIKQTLKNNARLADWHYSDEENAADVIKRADEFLEYLALFKEENILVVSHEKFIKVLIGYMLFGTSLTYKEIQRMHEVFILHNTSITLCEFENNDWKIHTWNDHAHLG